MKKTAFRAFLLCASLDLAHAQTSFVVHLDSAQEVPPTSSTAGGSGTLTLNADNTVTYDISYSGLAADFLAAHIHRPAGPRPKTPRNLPFSDFSTHTPPRPVPGATGALTGAHAA